MALKVLFFGLAVLVCTSAAIGEAVEKKEASAQPGDYYTYDANVNKAVPNPINDKFNDFSEVEEETLNNYSINDEEAPGKDPASSPGEANDEEWPEAPLDDAEEAPEAPLDDAEEAPEAPLDDAEEAPEAPLDDAEEAPESPLDDAEEAPESPLDDAEEAPEAPLDDAEEAPKAPLDDAEEAPEAPLDDAEETPEARLDDAEETPSDVEETSNDEEDAPQTADSSNLVSVDAAIPLNDEEDPIGDEPTSVSEDEEEVYHDEEDAQDDELTSVDDEVTEVPEALDTQKDDGELADPKASIKVNACKSKNGGCADKCRSILGIAICFCTKSGKTLGTDRKSCVKVEEGPCSKKNGGCSDKCINVFGDVVCVCTKAGQVLDKSGKKCIKLVCPKLKCDKKCKYGFQKDDNGCNTCKCNRLACPDKTCSKVCPIGYVTDKNGCAKCQCKLPLPGPTVIKQQLIHVFVATKPGAKPGTKQVNVRLTLNAFRYQQLRFVPDTCFLAASKLSINTVKKYLVKFRFPVDKTYVQRELSPTTFAFSFRDNVVNWKKDALNYIHCQCRICAKDSKQCNFANADVRKKLSGAKSDELEDDVADEVYQDQYVHVSAKVA